MMVSSPTSQRTKVCSQCLVFAILLCGLATKMAVAQELAGGKPIAVPADQVSSHVDQALANADEQIAVIVAIPDDQRNFDNTVGAIDDLLNELENQTNMNQFLSYVSPDSDIQTAGRMATEKLDAWLIDFGKNEGLYHAVSAYAATNPQLEGEQARLLRDAVRDYRRAGMDLSPEARAQLTAIQKQIAKLAQEFDTNILEDETTVLLTREELVGMDDDFIDGLKESNGVYVVTLDYPTFGPLLDYADDETSRQKVWTAYKRRGGSKNVQVLENILELRAQVAEMLGYETAADYETEVRMSKNAGRVAEFYAGLRPIVRKKAEQDWNEFTQVKRDDTGDPNAVLRPWDFSYYMGKLQQGKYAVDSKEVQKYFPINGAMETIFSINNKLFGVVFEEVTDQATAYGPALWHEDVRLFLVKDEDSSETLGMFYLDLHPRPGKYGHAAQWGVRQSKTLPNGERQVPVAALVCNFTKPTSDKPSLLTHDEMQTFLHEFGHGIHTILSNTQYASLGGTNVERDFVEAPSQMLENWVWEPEILAIYARHYETGEPIPPALVEGMIAAKNLGSGMLAEHQIYYGMVDQAYHNVPGGKADTTQLGLDLFEDIELYEAVPTTRFQAGFGHLTGYQAGYYGYLWSLVFAQDMYERFGELGLLSPEAGDYYRQIILSRGGSQDAMDMVVEYLGRDPRMDAFLNHLGLDPQIDQ